MVLKYRPISEVIRIFVLPEIDKRLREGRLSSTNFPIELQQFRAYQVNEGAGKIKPVVQLNNEVDLKIRTKLKDPSKKIEIGQILTTSEIELEECHIFPPEQSGKPCGYFYFNRVFLEPWMTFDFTPNAPGITEEELKELRIKLPVKQWFQEKKFVEIVKPYEKMDLLVSKNWPPAPCYYPQIYASIHKDVNFIESTEFMPLLNSLVNSTYWKERLEFFDKVNLFPKRIEYIRKAVQAYLNKDYICSIYALCPQFEGIIREYLELNHIGVADHYKANLNSLKALIFSRRVLLYPKKFINIIFEYLENGSFWSHTSQIHSPEKIINRHGILHGIFTQFESEELSLKFLMLLDSLAFSIFSDRLATGSL
jgi:hypothetical protein